jgi:hypothetical protein
MSIAKYSPIARPTGGPSPYRHTQGHVNAEFRVTPAWHTTTGSPLLRYDRNITAPFREDDSLFILEHFPLSAPVYAYDFLDGTKGSVLQTRPARRMGRNGQLRILFHEVAPPNGIEQKVGTTLEGGRQGGTLEAWR